MKYVENITSILNHFASYLTINVNVANYTNVLRVTNTNVRLVNVLKRNRELKTFKVMAKVLLVKLVINIRLKMLQQILLTQHRNLNPYCLALLNR